MPQNLSLSRAARLVGVNRVDLQKKIREGELASFDGTVTLDDLLAAYPDVQLEDNTEYSRVAKIKEQAFGKRVFERAMPDVETLAARIAELSRELAQNQNQLRQFNILLDRLRARLNEMEVQCKVESGPTMSDLKSWLAGEIKAASEPDYDNPLAVRDNLLRVAAAHVSILPGHHDFFIDGPDSILDAALRAGVPLNYGCSGGNCGLCKAKVVSGQIRKIHNHDYVLTEVEKTQGYALMCCNTAVTDLELEAEVAGGVQDIPFQQIAAKVKAITALTPDMALLHLQTPRTNRLRFLAGQSVTLRLGGAIGSVLPIASCPCDDRNLLFHVRRRPGNMFSDYLFDRLKNHDVVDIDGPRGEFILQEKSPRPLCFIAFDTGFAPIKSLIEHALSLNQAEAIRLYWIGSNEDSIYLPNVARSWADALDNFSYTALVAGFDLANLSGKREESLKAMLDEMVKGAGEILNGDIYIAGQDAAAAAAEQFFLGKGLPKARVFCAGQG